MKKNDKKMEKTIKVENRGKSDSLDKLQTKKIVERKILTINDKLALAVVALVSIAAFFYLATSNYSNFIKVPAILALLVGSGKVIAKLGGYEEYYGIIIFRGKRGFAAMRYFAKYPRIMRAIADFGLSLGFGMLYSIYIYKGNWKKILAHFVLICAFFYGFIIYGNPTIYNDSLPYYLSAIGIAGGLLIFGVASLAIQAYMILTVSGSSAGATLVVPGVTIPFWEGLIAIIIAAGVHEISHGILALVEKLEVKNSGAILFGILPIGAFVEPNEEKLATLEIQKKRRILIAGTTSNFILFMIFTAVGLIASPLVLGMANGVEVVQVSKDGTANGLLAENEVIYSVDGTAVKNYPEFASIMKNRKEGETVMLATDLGAKKIVLGKNGKMGIAPANSYPMEDLPTAAVLFLFGTLGLIILINFALAVINLVPIFLTDGYRLVFEEAKEAFPSKNNATAKRVAIIAGIASVILLLINFLPNFK
ncbi:site-2 protease family protein [Candidatus Micrarchaeota archaeon]|nr:site-2 protease family protein [Candidatus Micrarchaeota archaeon]